MRLSHRIPGIAVYCALTIVPAFVLAGRAQDQPASDPERQEALRLYQEHKMPEAAALLEKVAARKPDDSVVHEALGSALLSRAETQTDPAQRKADRLHARAELQRAKELGDSSDLCRVLLAGIPDDGGDVSYSANKEVQAVMTQGEAAFAKGDFDQAIREYSLALEMDPKLYESALYIGDIYFRQQKMDLAGEWFARAIQIDQDRETAYRYWGDSLLKQGKMKEARAKYIEGLVADPYRHTSWIGLNNWVQQNHLTYRQFSIQRPKPPAFDTNGHTTITFDPTTFDHDDAGGAWITYPAVRAVWHNEKFQKEFPQEKTYRHTLKEEASALASTATVFDEGQQKKKAKEPNRSLVFLSRLKADDMIEPYVLLILPDAGIAQDYPAYRTANRDKMIAFVDKYILPPAPQ